MKYTNCMKHCSWMKATKRMKLSIDGWNITVLIVSICWMKTSYKSTFVLLKSSWKPFFQLHTHLWNPFSSHDKTSMIASSSRNVFWMIKIFNYERQWHGDHSLLIVICLHWIGQARQLNLVAQPIASHLALVCFHQIHTKF